MTDELEPPSRRFEKIAICSGHMIDAPGREQPRFPASKAEAVRAEIARQLDRWEVGNMALAICGAACGADILFAEECMKRGASLRLFLAQKAEDFVRDSVQHAGDEWVRRFHTLSEQAEVATLPESPDKDANALSIYERVNLWMIDTARREAQEGGQLYALLVWDEKPTGDGPGGTSDFEKRVRQAGGVIAIINPTTISAADA
jgi:hypothetical protein